MNKTQWLLLAACLLLAANLVIHYRPQPDRFRMLTRDDLPFVALDTAAGRLCSVLDVGTFSETATASLELRTRDMLKQSQPIHGTGKNNSDTPTVVISYFPPCAK